MVRNLLLVLGIYGDMDAQAEAQGTGRNLVPGYREFSAKGDAIVGKLMAWRELTGRNEGKYRQYTFDTDDGLLECHMGAYFDGHAGALMVVGGVYKVVFQGKEKLEGSGNSVNKFDCIELAAPIMAKK